MNKELIIEQDSVVQVNETGPEGWKGCFVQVSEKKKWGIQGWVQVPMQKGQAYIRLNWDQIEYIGQAAMTLKTEENES